MPYTTPVGKTAGVVALWAMKSRGGRAVSIAARGSATKKLGSADLELRFDGRIGIDGTDTLERWCGDRLARRDNPPCAGV